MEGFREKALEAVRGVQWIPEAGEKRIRNMIEVRVFFLRHREHESEKVIRGNFFRDCLDLQIFSPFASGEDENLPFF